MAVSKGDDGVRIEDHVEFPLQMFSVPRCYKDDLQAVLIPKGLITDRIHQLATEIHREIGDKPLTMLCVLKGSFRFFTTLVEELAERRCQCNSPIRVEFISVQSYENQTSSGQLDINGLSALDRLGGMKGINLLIVDDIVDTGATLTELVSEMATRVGTEGNVWTAVMVSKRTSQRRADAYKENFIAFSIPDKFIVGFGMDYNQMFRDLNHICVMNQHGVEKYRNGK